MPSGSESISNLLLYFVLSTLYRKVIENLTGEFNTIESIEEPNQFFEHPAIAFSCLTIELMGLRIVYITPFSTNLNEIHKLRMRLPI